MIVQLSKEERSQFPKPGRLMTGSNLCNHIFTTAAKYVIGRRQFVQGVARSRKHGSSLIRTAEFHLIKDLLTAGHGKITGGTPGKDIAAFSGDQKRH
jgi:hypothetical protein